MSRNPKLATDGVPPGAKSFGLLSLLHHHAFLAVLALAIFITSMAWLPRAFTWTTTKIRDYRTGRLYKTAHDHFRAGRFAEAIEDYSLILAIDPDNLYHCLHARTARRDCYVELGISYKALADADYLVHEFGMLPDVVLERGEIHLKFGNYQAAAADSEAVFSRADNERDHNRKYKAKRNAAFYVHGFMRRKVNTRRPWIC